MNLDTETGLAESAKAEQFPNHLPPGWKTALGGEAQKEYFQKLSVFLKKESAARKKVFPASENILRSLKELDLPQVRVVILGQDPYHGEGQALGRAFAVPDALRPKPPSLKNIFTEISSDLGAKFEDPSSELSGWIDQGVLLLNTVLSVRSGEPLSHRNQGWEIFTDKIISLLGDRPEPLVFLLWGANAQSKAALVHNKNHLILRAPHPSPLSAHRGFFGCRHFSKTNEFLKAKGLKPIDWFKTRA